ncbi:MAG: dipeptidase [bacterium]
MRRTLFPIPIFLFLLIIPDHFLQAQNTPQEKALRDKAEKLARQVLLIDTHIDVPYRLKEKWEDISQRTQGGNFDYERAKLGGLKVPFFSIYVSSATEFVNANPLADSLIDLVENVAKLWPDKFALAHSTSDVLKLTKQGLIALCLGMENGAPINHDLSTLTHFYKRGIRYITLTHGKDNHISDSSYDSTRTWHGLSFFGRHVVTEMNRLGIMVDISHLSDDAFYEVMRITKAPVIASHSSCRVFTPGFERNLSDEMIRLIAQNGGAVMVNFGSSFLNGEYQKKESEIWNYLDAHKLQSGDPEAQRFIQEFTKRNPLPKVTVADAANHIDHIISLVGDDYVGFGSDFDGVGDTLPDGLKDVSQYTNLMYELLKKGYSDARIKKICGENLMRVWKEVELRSSTLQHQSP